MIFENPAIRFATSGTLIVLYEVADRIARRKPGFVPAAPAPTWVRVTAIASLALFYVLIHPTGGALLGGYGNIIGVVLALVAMVMRAANPVRHPDLAGRSLFYVALPIAVGVPWGLLALSVPAVATSVYRCVRIERSGEPDADDLSPVAVGLGGPAPRYRLLPGVW
jgi:hypothetical protein